MTLDLDGKQVVVNADPRSDKVWLQIWACGGSLGVELDAESARKLSKLLWYAVRPSPDTRRMAETTGSVRSTGSGK